MLVKPVVLPAWAGKACDHAKTDRIDGRREHDRHGAGRLLQRPHDQAAARQDDVRRKRDQFGGIFASLREIAGGPANIDAHIAAFAPPPVLQRLPEHCISFLALRILRSKRPEYADPPLVA
jgi:hypothetical protein